MPERQLPSTGVRADPVMERPGDRSFVNDEEKTGSNQAGTEGGTTPAPGRG
ncbi:hypothetical protein MAHJHV29_49780 [Mycobacterium avium subsp. hominissuis]